MNPVEATQEASVNGRRKKTTGGKGARTMAQVVQAAGAQQRRMQLHADNQAVSIGRLLAAMRNDVPEDGAHATEITVLNLTLAATQQKLEDALAQKKALELALADTLPGANDLGGTEHDMGRRKDAFMAGFEAGETVDDRDQAWKDYKNAEAETASDDEDAE